MKGWDTRKLGDVAYLAGRIGWKGLTAKEYTKNGPLFLSVYSLNYGDYVDFRDACHISQDRYDESPEIMLQSGDVLICKDGAGIGKLGIIDKLPGPTTINSSLLLIRANASLHPKYLYHTLCGPLFQRVVQERIDGATTPHLYQREIRELEIPVPPLDEQRRIVAILDEVLQGIHKAIANSITNQISAAALVDERANSIFARPHPSWEKLCLADVCTAIEYGTASKSLAAGNIPVLRMGNIQNRKIDWSDLSYTDNADDIRRYALDPDDVLFNRTNSAEHVGKSAIYKGERPAIFAGYLIRLKYDRQRVNGEFLNYYLNSSVARAFGRSVMSQSVNQANISGAKLKRYPIFLPTMSEQIELAEELARLSSASKALVQQFHDKIACLKALKESVLYSSLSGKLRNRKTEQLGDISSRTVDAAAFTAAVLSFAHHRHVLQKREKTFGRVKAQKTLHLVESIAKVDLGRDPIKDAAGPNDFRHMLKAEDWAKSRKLFEFESRTNGYDFKPLCNYKREIEALVTSLGTHRDPIEKVVDLLIPMNSLEAEVFATVHAAWNNLLACGKVADDAAIVYEARENWHASKLKIPVSKFKDAIKLIRKKGLQPDGSAKPVRGQERLL